MTKNYNYDAVKRVHLSPNYESIAYSDGQEVEQGILAILRAASDVSVFSDELRNKISDWPTEYHLSARRHCILRPLPMQAADTVLELGCGCGAITRFLGESGLQVTSVEGSVTRAEIAAERCRDLPNVAIYADKLQDFSSEKKYDWVLLVGVLEYSRVYGRAEDPVLELLDKAKSFLAPKGRLVVAIENQLGLKYFNGAAEDHLGSLFYGVHDLYGQRDPVTFGRVELERRLVEAGMNSVEFYYPFPDYKVPQAIFSEQAFTVEKFKPADFLFAGQARDHTGKTERAFFEPLAWQPLARNNLMRDLSNSFLVVVSADSSRQEQPVKRWLACAFSTDRAERFVTETRVEATPANELAVNKRYLSGKEQLNPGESDAPFKHQLPVNPYYEGQQYILGLFKCLYRGGSPEQLAAWMAPWVLLLQENSLEQGEAAKGDWIERMLPGHWLDCVPFNLVQTKNGELMYFDAEWVTRQPVPVYWVLARGLGMSASFLGRTKLLMKVTYRQFITWSLQSCHVRFTADMLDNAASYENEFNLFVQGGRRNENDWHCNLDRPIGNTILLA